jgi:hypothetical protein
MKQIKEIISVLALLVAVASVVYARLQTIAAEDQVQIAKQSYAASIDQLKLAQQAQQIAEASYRVSIDQLDLQRTVVAADNRFQVVIGADSDENLQKSLSNGQDVSFSLFNGSKNAVAYHVLVKSDGIGLNWSGRTPEKMYYVMPMDARPVLLQTNEFYKRSFSVWFSKLPVSAAKIGIYVNDVLAVEYSYTYSQLTKTYAFRTN